MAVETSIPAGAARPAALPNVRAPAASAALAALPVMVVLLLGAWPIHWHTFVLDELGLDGALSVDLARSPLREMLIFNARDVHPPLYYAALKGWFTLVGPAYLTAKFPSIAASLLALCLLYAVGRRVASPWTALFAAVLLALSPAYLMQSPTVRDFMPGLALTLATLLLTVQLLRLDAAAPGRLPRLAALAALTAAALLTWYFHVFVLAAEALLLLTRGRRRGLWALAVGAVVAAPWYVYVAAPVLGKLRAGTTTFGAPPHAPSLAAAADGLARAMSGWPLAQGGGLALAGWLLALALGVGVGIVQLRRGAAGAARAGRTGAVLILSGLALGALEIGAVTLRWTDPGSLGRYILALLPFVVLAQALALTGPRRWVQGLGFIGVVASVVVQLLWFHGLVTGAPIDWSNDPARAYLVAHSQPDDAALFSDRARRARYLLDGGALPTAVIHTAGQPYLADSAADADRTATALVESARRVWYLQEAQHTAPAQAAEAAVASHAYLVWQQTFGGDLLQLYATQPPAPPQPVNATLGGIIRLDAATHSAAVAPGAPLVIGLTWHDLQPTPTSYSVFVHLDDVHGKTVAQHDGAPVLGLRPTNSWHAGEVVNDRFSILLPADIPPGEYHLNAGLYVGQQRLTLPDGTNAIGLGVVRVGT